MVYKCKYCNKEYKSSSARSNHVDIKHFDIVSNIRINKLPITKCKYCKNDFCDRSYVQLKKNNKNN